MIIILFAAILPFFLWPIEMLLPYPFIVEELAKALLVYWILVSVSGKSTQIKIAILVGVLFSFSESILYLVNILQVGNGWTIVQRLLLTTPLHVITILIMLFFGMWKKTYLILGVLLAMLLHYWFNLFAVAL